MQVAHLWLPLVVVHLSVAAVPAARERQPGGGRRVCARRL